MGQFPFYPYHPTTSPHPGDRGEPTIYLVFPGREGLTSFSQTCIFSSGHCPSLQHSDIPQSLNPTVHPCDPAASAYCPPILPLHWETYSALPQHQLEASAAAFCNLLFLWAPQSNTQLPSDHTSVSPSILTTLQAGIFFFFFFLGPHPQHVEVPRLVVESELQLPAYTPATATEDPSCICDLHHSSQWCRMLNPLIKARDQTRILMNSSQICFCCATTGTPSSSDFQR